MKHLLPLLLAPTLVWADAVSPLEGGTRTIVGTDVLTTFTASGTLVVTEPVLVRALFVGGGGGGGGAVGGGGGGDSGNTPASPGTDGGGDGTAFETGLPGGDGADGLGAGGGGSGFGYHATGRGGYGGCGTVIVAYDLRPAGTMILVK